MDQDKNKTAPPGAQTFSRPPNNKCSTTLTDMCDCYILSIMVYPFSSLHPYRWDLLKYSITELPWPPDSIQSMVHLHFFKTPQNHPTKAQTLFFLPPLYWDALQFPKVLIFPLLNLFNYRCVPGSLAGRHWPAGQSNPCSFSTTPVFI